MDASCQRFSSPRDFSTQDVMLVPTLYGRTTELIRKLVSRRGDDVDTCRLRNLAAVANSPQCPASPKECILQLHM